jgi:hypothetical protein
MKAAAFCLLLTAFVGVGCEGVPKLWQASKPPAPAVAAQPPKPRPVVTPEQVTDSNAHDMAKQLLNEMDRDAQGELPPAADKSVPDTKAAADKHK